VPIKQWPGSFLLIWIGAFILVSGLVMLAPISSRAQIFVFSKDELTALTAKNPFERFPDGRPRILDSMLERARSLSM
jgi:hypothetical protein